MAMRRAARTLAFAYAVSVTLLAAWWGLQSWTYRRLFEGLAKRDGGRPPRPFEVRSLYLDYGVSRTTWDELAIRIADANGFLIAGVIGLIVVGTVGLAAFLGMPPESSDSPAAAGPGQVADEGCAEGRSSRWPPGSPLSA
jgi:hypothetical protein